MSPRRPRCTCGHSHSAHRSCTWKRHERGNCTGWVPAVVVAHDYGEDVLQDATPCPCTQYEPEEAA